MRAKKDQALSDPLFTERPATTPDARESQMIALATNLVEERLRNGTASSAEVVHYLKLGSSRERLEREKLKTENQLLHAKIEVLQAAKVSEEMYTEALAAFRSYSGSDDPI